MNIILAIILGALVLIAYLLPILERRRLISEINKAMEDSIRVCWKKFDLVDPKDRDNMALQMMRELCTTMQSREQYRLVLGAIRSLSEDIVKDKQRLEKFKKSVLLYGCSKGWIDVVIKGTKQSAE